MAVVARDGDRGRRRRSIPPGGGNPPVRVDGWPRLAVEGLVDLPVGRPVRGDLGAVLGAGLGRPQLLPPPHIFLSNFGEQGKFFNTATRWQVGNSDGRGTDRPSDR